MIVLVFDTETTGLIDNMLVAADRQPEIIEWASILVDLDSATILSEYETLVRPRYLSGPRLSEKPKNGKKSIEEITGISDAMVAGAPFFADVVERIVQEVDAAPSVLAHNAQFDVSVVDVEFGRLGGSLRWPEVICTIEQSLHYFGRRASLGDLHRHLLGEPHVGAHRAMADVQALVLIATEMRARGDL